MSDTLYVTPAQVLAAKLAIELSEEDGEEPDEALRAIANAQVVTEEQPVPTQRTSTSTRERATHERAAQLLADLARVTAKADLERARLEVELRLEIEEARRGAEAAVELQIAQLVAALTESAGDKEASVSSAKAGEMKSAADDYDEGVRRTLYDDPDALIHPEDSGGRHPTSPTKAPESAQSESAPPEEEASQIAQPKKRGPHRSW